MVVWGVLFSVCRKARKSGSSPSSAMPLVTRTAVFMQLRVVPKTAIMTVRAMVTMSAKPKPGTLELWYGPAN